MPPACWPHHLPAACLPDHHQYAHRRRTLPHCAARTPLPRTYPACLPVATWGLPTPTYLLCPSVRHTHSLCLLHSGGTTCREEGRISVYLPLTVLPSAPSHYYRPPFLPPPPCLTPHHHTHAPYLQHHTLPTSHMDLLHAFVHSMPPTHTTPHPFTSSSHPHSAQVSDTTTTHSTHTLPCLHTHHRTPHCLYPHGLPPPTTLILTAMPTTPLPVLHTAGHLPLFLPFGFLPAVSTSCCFVA